MSSRDHSSINSDLAQQEDRLSAEDDNRRRVHQLWQAKLAEDIWNGWRALLGNWKIENASVPVDPNTPFQGYYRSKRQDGTFEPVAFFKDKADKWVCLRPTRSQNYTTVIEGDHDWDRVLGSWPHISRRPISHAWYKLVAEEGKPWPDADARVTSDALKVADKTPYANGISGGEQGAAAAGHNNPPEETPSVALKNKIENAKGGLADYKVINDEETLSKAKSLKNRLTELKGEGEKARETLSRPNLDALQVIRAEWSPLVDEAAAAAKTINNAMDAYETRKLQAHRAEEQRIANERAEAERIRIANEAKTQQAEATGTQVELQPVPEVKPAAPTAPPVNTKVTAGYGRAGSVKTEWKVTEITDAAALFAFLTSPKIHSELATKMLELAQRAKDAGFDPPGVKIEEIAKVRG